jgi:cytidyltransferase-like protein
MKFGKTLRDSIIQEWRFYSVDYKAMKKALKDNSNDEESDSGSDGYGAYADGDEANAEEFFDLYESSKDKLQRFYADKEGWAVDYMNTLEDRVEALRDTSANPPSPATENESESDGEETDPAGGVSSPTSSATHSLTISRGHKRRVSTNCAWLKDEYRRVGKSKHFQNYIYSIKSLCTFDRELDLLLEFLDLNKTAFSKILKKYDKRTGSMIREEKLAELHETHSFLDGEVLSELKDRVTHLIDEVHALKPNLPEGWEERKVYTIGCFDLFHRGHQNALMSLREFGYFIVAGIHDDESYFKLKNKYTIDNLETRMKNVKPFVDQLYVIPGTDTTPYLKAMVSEQDIETGSCCYARGDDMLQFPGREWVESVMPVHFVPRTENCSSTLLRTMYHAEDKELRKKAAFAKTRYDGKPVDENGNVLKLSHAASCPAHMHAAA